MKLQLKDLIGREAHNDSIRVELGDGMFNGELGIFISAKKPSGWENDPEWKGYSKDEWAYMDEFYTDFADIENEGMEYVDRLMTVVMQEYTDIAAKLGFVGQYFSTHDLDQAQPKIIRGEV